MATGDGTPIQSGTATFNGSIPASWVGADSRWEYTTSEATPQSLALYVSAVDWTTYNITSLSSQASNYTVIIWDDMKVANYTASNTNLNINSNATMNATILYGYSGALDLQF